MFGLPELFYLKYRPVIKMFNSLIKTIFMIKKQMLFLGMQQYKEIHTFIKLRTKAKL